MVILKMGIECGGKLFMHKQKIESHKNNVKKWIMKHRTTMITIVAVILFCLIAPFINLLVNTEAFIFPSFLGFITIENKDAWIGFFGAIIGGAITLLGVAWTIIDQNNKRREDAMDDVKPILVANACTYEKIKGIKGDEHSKVFECILEYKNVGKGILFNPRVFNIDCKVDNTDIGKLHTTFSVKSFLDVADTSDNDLMIEFDLNALNKMQELLEGRGNVLPVHIIMYVGGKDIHDRDVVSKLDYKTSLAFFTDNKIELPLHGGKYTSIVITDKNEIIEIVNNANPHYNVHI